MGTKINTGNYRVCRHKLGIGGSQEILKTGNKVAIDLYWATLRKDNTYEYYREEEVFYRGTMKEGDKEIDSSPVFIRMDE